MRLGVQPARIVDVGSFGKIAAGVLTSIASLFAGAGIERYDMVDKVFPPDDVACPRTSTSINNGDPIPTGQAIVILEGEDEGRGGNKVGFKLCWDKSPDAVSEFWYFGMSPGPITNLLPASKVIDDPARYETDRSASTTYFSVDCSTNVFAYTTAGVERPYGFDQSQC